VGKGIRVCLNFMGGTNARRLADEVEAYLDIIEMGEYHANPTKYCLDNRTYVCP
jgi:hypothetical protein